MLKAAEGIGSDGGNIGVIAVLERQRQLAHLVGEGKIDVMALAAACCLCPEIVDTGLRGGCLIVGLGIAGNHTDGCTFCAVERVVGGESYVDTVFLEVDGVAGESALGNVGNGVFHVDIFLGIA